MRFRTAIPVVFGLLVSMQCTSNQKSYNLTQPLLSSSIVTPGILHGEWEYCNSIWYSSEITFFDNGTFKFHDQGCYGQRFSQGQWSVNNGIAELTSFDSFKQNEEETKEYKSEKAESTKNPAHEIETRKIEYTLSKIKDIAPVFLPEPNDTVRVYLNKVQLQLRGDTLYYVGNKKFFEGAKFYRAEGKHY